MIAVLKSRRSLTVIGMALVAVGGLAIVGAATMSVIVAGIAAALTGFVVLLFRPQTKAHQAQEALLDVVWQDKISQHLKKAKYNRDVRSVMAEQAPLPPELENGMLDVVADIPDSFYTALKRR